MTRIWPLVPLLLLPMLPGVPVQWVTLADYAGIAAVLVLGLVVLTGFGAMTSFGQASFMGFGAYATALLTLQGVSPWLALPASLLAAGLAALLVGAVALRLSGHTLALGTIAWSVSLYYVVGTLDLLGRNDGLSGLPPLHVGGTALLSSRAYFPVVAVALLAALLATRNLLDGRVGRTIRALRAGRMAASLGVSLPRARLVAFVHAGVLAGLAGWLYAHLQRTVNPAPFGLEASIGYLLMAVLGGAGHLWGALLGAVLVTVLDDRLQDLLPRLGLGAGTQGVVFGAILVVMLQAAPEGLWPLLVRRRPPRARPVRTAAPLAARSLPTRGTAVLQATGLRRTFGGLVAVADLSLSLAAGEIVGLIGPNGAGKSTTFNLLSGVSHPTAGRIEFLGATLPGGAVAAARRGIARSFQHVRLVPGMSVLENAALGAHGRGRAGALRAMLRLDRAEEARLFAEARRQLARVGLAAQAPLPAEGLALGQQRLAEIARALCLDPVLLLLDEPAAGLRHAEKQALAALLRRLREEGVTVLLVEHDMGFVMGLADRLVVMQFGTELAEGTAEAIRADPAVIEAYLGAPA